MENRNDLKILGSGEATGGFFYEVSINGSGKINGDLNCIEFKCNGSGDVNGKIETKNLKINGTGKIKGTVESDEIKVNGTAILDGDTVCKKIIVNGTTEILGKLSAEDVELRGALKVRNNCETEVFNSKGGFSIGGLLKARTIEVELYGSCSAREINGEKINIKKGTTFKFTEIIKSFFNFGDLFPSGLSAGVIEGDEIYLENTKAKVVRGNNITIGAGCEIDLIEYKVSFNKSNDSKIIENRNI